MSLSAAELTGIAKKVRAELEEYRDSGHPTLGNFPKGACGDAALVLGTYLADLGEEPFDYVLAMRGKADPGAQRASHAWLERADLVIDITADQFDGMDNPVIVTTDSDWHRTWEEVDRKPSYLDAYEHDGPDQLRPVYESVKKRNGRTI